MHEEPQADPAGRGAGQLFPPWSTLALRVALVGMVVLPLLSLGVLMALQYTPYVTGQGIAPPQPVPFSHAHHVGELGLDCRYCHASVEQSRFAGLPSTQTCMTCHSQIWTNAAVLAPVRESLARGVPIAWRRVNTLPGYVYFDHGVHVANGVGCTTCHGPVETMPLTRQAAPLTMGWCLDCHRRPQAHLRPREEIFSTGWTPPADQEARGLALMRQYHVRTDHLTDCSVCHR